MTTDSDLVQRMRGLAQVADASGGISIALVELAEYVERVERHQAELEEKLATLRAQHMPPAHFPTRVDELVEDRASKPILR